MRSIGPARRCRERGPQAGPVDLGFMVGQRGHYSNPSPPGVRAKRPPVARAELLDPDLWEAIENLARTGTTPARPRGHPSRPRKQDQRRLSAGEASQLIAQYQAGATTLELAKAHGIHRTTVLALLERNQVSRRGRVWTPDLTERALRLNAQGRSCATIAHQFEVNPETVRQRLLRAGVTLRPRGRRSSVRS